MANAKRKPIWGEVAPSPRLGASIFNFGRATPVQAPPRRDDTMRLIGRMLTADDDEDPFTS